MKRKAVRHERPDTVAEREVLGQTVESRYRLQAVFAGLRELLRGGMGQEVRTGLQAALHGAENTMEGGGFLRQHDGFVWRVGAIPEKIHL